MQEIWKDIAGYEGRYQVSNLGNVKSLGFFAHTVWHSREKMLKKFATAKDRYVRVTLVRKKIKVHLLVWDHFGEGQRNGRMIQVDHIDSDKSNCSIYNLRLLTSRANKVKEIAETRDLPTGVTYNKRNKNYFTRIYFDGKYHYLGVFQNPISASMAYQRKLSEIERAA